jgi:hypothetical protein
VTGLTQRSLGAQVRHRVDRMADQAAHERHRHDAGEERADVEGPTNLAHARARDAGVDQPLADVDEVGLAKRLGEARMRSPVSRDAMVLGDDERKLL